MIVYMGIIIYVFLYVYYMIDGHRWCSEGLDMYVRSIHMYTYIHSILLVRIYIFQILYIHPYIHMF